MSDFEQEPEIDLALQRVNVHWNAQQTERALAGLHKRMQRRARTAQVGVGVAALALGVWLFGPRVGEMYRSAVEARAERAAPAERAPITFSDGSKLTALDSQTRVSVLEAVPERIVAGVDPGSVRFEVSHRPERVFRAEAGNVAVEALGTIFTVERLDPGVWVSVTRGRVRVQWPSGSRELAAAEADWFPPRAVDGAVASSTATAEPQGSTLDEIPAVPISDDEAARPASGEALRGSRWKALAAQGKHREAYDALGSLTPTQLRNPEELLMAADTARLSGHPSHAVPFLERVLSQFRRDPRAPLAAFTLGRTLIALGNPARAAQRFAEVRSFAPSGSLPEDALAREVEAWSLAGQQDRARERALSTCASTRTASVPPASAVRRPRLIVLD
jgi:transmembrane sensor